MKLNHNCVRDLLLHVEDNIEYGFYLDVNTAKIKDYTQHEILYSADKLLEAGFIVATRKEFMDNPGVPRINISSITWNGHQFLDNIRDNKVWGKTKDIISKFSSVSISMVSNIASQVITSIVKEQMGL